jgi:chemotaxis protein CheD
MPEKDPVVGIAEVKTARDPERLTAFGLGSCVGVVLYDDKNRVGGLAHAMLPSSRFHPDSPIPGKYADSAIEFLLKILLEEGAELGRLKAKLVGGANMFSDIVNQSIPIGMRNVSAAREKLLEKGIPVIGEDVGGTQGRTVVFSLADGKIEIRKFGKATVWI